MLVHSLPYFHQARNNFLKRYDFKIRLICSAFMRVDVGLYFTNRDTDFVVHARRSFFRVDPQTFGIHRREKSNVNFDCLLVVITVKTIKV